jgi:hypothetical protein
MDKFSEFGRALDKESAEWLQYAQPEIFECLEIAVIRGATEEELRAYVRRRVGTGRDALAKRCEVAARYLIAQRTE